MQTNCKAEKEMEDVGEGKTGNPLLPSGSLPQIQALNSVLSIHFLHTAH